MDILEKNHKTIIDGTYNASVDSMKSSIDVLTNYKKRKVAILADMLELGDYSQQLHEEVPGGLGELRRSFRWQPHSQVVLQGSAVL